MKENFSTILFMGKDCFSGNLVRLFRENGKAIRFLDMVL